MDLANVISYASLVPLYAFILLIFYRLVLHPLAKVPGPKIAALTGWYEFYWDCLKKGQYVFRIQEMHALYGKLFGPLS